MFFNIHDLMHETACVASASCLIERALQCSVPILIPKYDMLTLKHKRHVFEYTDPHHPLLIPLLFPPPPTPPHLLLTPSSSSSSSPSLSPLR